MSPRPSVIAVDIDNVLADTDDVVRRLIRDLFDVHSTRDEITTWEYSSSLPITAEQERQVFNTLHREYLSSIPDVPGAIAGMSHLRTLAPIWIITARPEWSRSATEDWLTSFGFVYDTLLFSASKSNIAVPAIFFIDDNPETANQLIAKSKRIFLMDRPWNRDILDSELLTRVSSWSDIQRRADDLPQINRSP